MSKRGSCVTLVKVRTYEATDYDSLKALMLELTKHTNVEFDENRFKRTLDRRSTDKYNRQGILVAEEDDGTVVGMVLAETLVSPAVEIYGYISNFVVKPTARGRGIGKALVDKTFEFFAEMGVARVETNVRDLTNAEGKLFAKFGFEKKYIVMEKKVDMEKFLKQY